MDLPAQRQVDRICRENGSLRVLELANNLSLVDYEVLWARRDWGAR